MNMNLLFLILTLIVVCYTVLVMAAILGTWVPGLLHGALGRWVHRLTRPWLNLFQRLKFLRVGGMDFSVIPALLVLQMLIQVFYALYYRNLVTFGLVLALVVDMLMSSVGFILVFFFVLAAIRFIGMAAGASSVGRLWLTLDQLLQPVVYPLVRFLSPHRSIPYGTGLAIFSGVLILAWIILGLITQGLLLLCSWIPF